MRLQGISKEGLSRISKKVNAQEEFAGETLHPWDVADKIREYLSDDQFISELLKAMTTNEALENLKFIAQNWDIPLDDEEY